MADDASARKLASIVAVDMAGYSRRTEADEAAAIGAVTALKARVTAAVLAHGGRVFNTAGDGFMLEFPTASGALAAAERIAESENPSVRVGVHLGEVSPTDSGDLLGHGVNVAARIQQMAAPGAVLVSSDVKRAVRGPLGERLRPQGTVRLDKMSETLPVFALAPVAGGRARGRRRNFSRLLAAGVGGLALVVTGLGAWLLRDASLGREPTATAIAVVPFTAVGTGSEARDFAEGLTDALQNAVDANDMQTVSRQDAGLLSGPDRDQRVRRLGVRLLLGGTVESDGSTMRASVRLDDPRRHVTLWTTQKQGPATRPEALQAQVGALTISVMNCSASALRPKGGLTDPEALGLFLKACGVFEEQVGLGDHPEAIYSSLDTFRRAVAQAPGFAGAHSALAKYLAYYRRYQPPAQQPQLTAEADREARAALAIDPKDPEAYVALSLLRPQEDLIGREQLLDKALASDPSWLYALNFKSGFLWGVGRMKEALAYSQRTAARNPLSTDMTLDLPLAMTGHYREAEQVIAQMSKLWPASWFWPTRLLVYEGADDWRGLETTLDDPDRPANVSDSDVAFLRLYYTALRTHSPEAMTRARQALLTRRPDSFPGTGFQVYALSQLGLEDDAFALAERLAAGGLDHQEVFFVPKAAVMRRDSRLMPLMAKLGLVNYWRSTGQWPDFCAEPGLPYDCKAEAARLTGARHG